MVDDLAGRAGRLGSPVRRVPRLKDRERRKGTIKANDLLKRIESKNAPVIIDPRSEMEFKKGHIPGAINAPVRKLLVNSVQLPSDKNCEIVSACMHGQRAWIAKKLLGLRGYTNMVFLDGWIQDWIKDGLPLEK